MSKIAKFNLSLHFTDNIWKDCGLFDHFKVSLPVAATIEAKFIAEFEEIADVT